MIFRRWLSWLNMALLGLVSLFLIGMAIYSLKASREVACNDPEAKVCRLPKSGFALSTNAYEAIGAPLLELQIAPPSIQVPDLKQQLIYYGRNSRPDVLAANENLHFSFNGSKQIAPIAAGEKLYLVYDKSQNPPRYNFSPENKETSLWLEAHPTGNEVQVALYLRRDSGEVTRDPISNSLFKLVEKEYVRFGGGAWEIEGHRVDATLLARQKARWFGNDHFIDQHGGDEYKSILGKQRIDFGDDDQAYSVFADVGDTMIWKDKKWQTEIPGSATREYPLLVIKKIDERLMALELWDVTGKSKVVLNLLKSSDPWMAQNGKIIENTFKFVGAKTRTSFVFESNHERIIISPQDWLVYVSPTEGWKKLETEEEIDNYVSRKQPMGLFVFEGLSKQDDQPVAIGTLFSPSRAESKRIEMPIQQRGNLTLNSPKTEISDDDDDEDEDVIKEKGKRTTVKPQTIKSPTQKNRK